MTTSETRAGRTPQQARSRQKVEDILDEAEAIIEAEGVGGLTMRKVAKGSGVGQATLYGYFPNLESILSAVADRMADAVTIVLSDIPDAEGSWTSDDLSDAYLCAFMRIYEEQRGAHQIFEAVPLNEAEVEAELLTRTGFTERFSRALQAIVPQMPNEDAARVAIGYYRIADAFLWQDSVALPDKEPWHRLLRQTLRAYLAAAALEYFKPR
ncbi:TetR/AcrR family transcriptional regulator [Algihabitans albus]|uniref:TetR/AcrR family transcriptional regulator n=1 Tax=Algihabitans albus TaxID=2164067 RepID=UPI0035CECB5F